MVTERNFKDTYMYTRRNTFDLDTWCDHITGALICRYKESIEHNMNLRNVDEVYISVESTTFIPVARTKGCIRSYDQHIISCSESNL